VAYISGTATDYTNLLAILATFASNNGWAIQHQTATALYLKGEGATGTDEIYAGINAYENTTSGYYNWELFGSWSYRAGRAYGSMPRSAAGQYLYLWNQSIPYWISVTKRRIILVAKISTIYQMMHIGLLDPIGTATQYPYPLLIAGSGSVWNQNYTVTGDNNRSFWSNSTAKCGQLSTPGGYWQNVKDNTICAVTASIELKSSMYTALDGSYLVEQIFCTDNNQTTTFGAIDGLYRVSGYNNSSENIITISGANYAVFQDIYRVGVGDYCALRMN